MPAGGYFGQALVVDAATRTSAALPLPDEILRAYLSGYSAKEMGLRVR
jgi:hypothetical protein